MWFPDSIYQPITTKTTKRRDTLGTIIPSVAPIPPTVGIYLSERLIHPIPNTTALSHRFRLENVPIIFQSPHAVTHSVSIFTKNEGAINIRLCKISLYLVYTTIHTAINIGIEILFCPFILYRTVSLHRFQPLVSFLKINSVAGFITQRPNRNRRIILCPLIHTAGAVHVCTQPRCILSQSRRTVPHSMRFDIRLVYNIKTIPIAQLIPIGMIRIMGTTHCIDIILLHQLYIFQHQLFTNRTALF